jgi:parallel beta-helix repeat protein
MTPEDIFISFISLNRLFRVEERMRLLRKNVSGIMLVMLLIGMLTLAFNVQPGRASGTIYIRADGTIDPPTAPISTVDNVTYTLTCNINDSIVIERDNIMVDGAGYIVQGTGAWISRGIDLSERKNVTVKNMEIRAFWYGIYLYSSSNNGIYGNNMTNNTHGIYFYSDGSLYNSIYGNNMTNNGYGIYLWGSSNNGIYGNNMTNNSAGIYLDGSSNNSIVGNTFFNDGLVVSSSYGNLVTENLVNGKPLVYLEAVSNIAVGDAGQVILIRCKNVQIENLNLSYTTIGIQLLETSNAKIANNNIANNGYGISLGNSSNNSVSENNITANGNGIDLGTSDCNYLYGNSLSNNYAGMFLWLSHYNTIRHNHVSSNNRGIEVFGNSRNNTLEQNVFSYNREVGIWVMESAGIKLVENFISNNNIGIFLRDDDGGREGHIIIGNTIYRNYRGIHFVCWPPSSPHYFYHNNIEKNTYQVDIYSVGEWTILWDNGYPSGGNYWSDYNGTDLYNGPYQNMTGSDGIGDIPYVIKGNTRDEYPLMRPFYSSSTTKFPWPEFQHDVANTGFTMTLAPNANTTRWTYQAGIIWTAPAVDEGKVVFGDYNNTFYALDANTGSLVWEFKTNSIIVSSPAIYNGKVYFGSYDHNVYCLNLITGLEIWKYSLSYPIIAGPTVVNGSVYVPTGGYLWAFDADNGSLIWSYQLSPVGTSDSTPAYSDGKLVFGASNGYVYAVNATNGSLIWSYKISLTSTWASPTVDEERVFIPFLDGNLYCLDENTGTLLWNRTISGPIWKYDVMVSSPAVAYGIVHVGATEWREGRVLSYLYGINATTGEIVWTFQTNDEIYFSPAIADGKVYFGSSTYGAESEDYYYALNAMTGEVVWKYQLTAPDEGFVGMGSAIADGVLYVGTFAPTHSRLPGEKEYGRIIAFSTMWTVDDDGPADFHTIQEAINVANPGDTIYVRNGTYYENVVLNKTVSLVGEDIENTIVDGSGINVMAYNVVIRGFTIRNSFGPSIHIHQNANATVQNNYITNGLGGIHLDNSSGNYIADNTITNLTDIGIWLDVSGGNTLRNNNMTNNQYDFGVWGESLQHYMNDIDASNTVDGKPICYWVNRHNEQVPLDAGYVQLVNCTNITVKDLNLTNNLFNVFLAFTNNSLITNNIITNGEDGIDLMKSEANTIFGNTLSIIENGILLFDSESNNIVENTVTNSYWPIGLYDASRNNTFFHNNIVSNACPVYAELANTWNNGYPSGGNYWGDYTGVDNFMGPYQNETGSDGIGDTPYIIDVNNQDKYPLMGPFGGSTIEGGNSTIFPSEDVCLQFQNVTVGGLTAVNKTEIGPEPPHGFKLAEHYYDITTTANYTGTIKIRIIYDDSDMTQEEEIALQLKQWNETSQQWVDITTHLDIESNVIYGETIHLSMFAIMTPTVPIHDIAIVNITFSNQFPTINETITIYTTIKNNGYYIETFDLSINYTLILDPLIGTQTITLAPGESIQLNFTWTPNATGRYEIKAYTSTMPDDVNPSDNTKIVYLYVSATYTSTFSAEEDSWMDMGIRGGRFYYRASPI